MEQSSSPTGSACSAPSRPGQDRRVRHGEQGGARHAEQDDQGRATGHLVVRAVGALPFQYDARRPFGDARVRQALQLVFDYKRWADNYYSEGLWEHTGPLAAAFPEAIPSSEIAKLPGWNPATKEQDIKKAKDLMTAAGYPDGAFPFKFFVQAGGNGFPWNDYAIQAQDTLKRIWPAMDVSLDVAPDSGTFGTRSVQSDFDVVVYVIYSAPDAVLDLTDAYHSNGSRNYGKFKDAQIDQLLEKAATQLDTTQRTATFKEIQDKLITTHMPIITIAQPKQIEHLSPKLRGIENLGRPFGGALRDVSQSTKNFWFER
ncbi:MAG: ABC transporter substrate-binding protein [Dehalococcoidia bacterium]